MNALYVVWGLVAYATKEKKFREIPKAAKKNQGNGHLVGKERFAKASKGYLEFFFFFRVLPYTKK
jgi:hypothetical protein